jgi:hypothetical protein
MVEKRSNAEKFPRHDVSTGALIRQFAVDAPRNASREAWIQYAWRLEILPIHATAFISGFPLPGGPPDRINLCSSEFRPVPSKP